MNWVCLRAETAGFRGGAFGPRLRPIGCIAAIAIVTLSLASCRDRSRLVARTAEIMATKIVVELEPGPEGDREAKAVFDLFRSIDREMSSYKPDSALSRINREAGVRPVKVSRRLFALLKESRHYGDLTGGAFDITFAALSDVWSFENGSEPCLPSPKEVLARLPQVDYRLLQLDAAAGTAYLPRRGMRIGLGGIAKGYALRLAAKRLHRMGVGSFLLSAGRQIYCAGRPHDRPAWRIAIQDPRKKRGSRLALVSVQDASIATSGDNERCFVLDGVRYHHLLDPSTGYPVRGVREVVVVCRDPVMADALATGLFVQGSLDLARALPGVEAAMLDDHDQFTKTKGFPLVSGFEHVPLSEQASRRVNPAKSFRAAVAESPRTSLKSEDETAG